MMELLGGFKNAAFFCHQAPQPTDILDILVVKVNHEMPTRFEVVVNALQTGNLLLRSVEILERMARYECQTECLSQIKRTHIRLYPFDARDAFAFLSGHVKHFGSKIEAHNLCPILGQTNGNSSSSAGELKHAFPLTPDFGSKLAIELDLAGPVWDGLIVGPSIKLSDSLI
jgi:hypothetical protein